MLSSWQYLEVTESSRSDGARNSLCWGYRNIIIWRTWGSNYLLSPRVEDLLRTLHTTSAIPWYGGYKLWEPWHLLRRYYLLCQGTGQASHTELLNPGSDLLFVTCRQILCSGHLYITHLSWPVSCSMYSITLGRSWHPISHQVKLQNCPNIWSGDSSCKY